MENMKILGDSSLDLTEELETELNAQRTVPFYLDIAGETIVDDENLSMPDFMAKMNACTGKMGSACPSPEKWKDVFLKAGGGFAITISGKLSARPFADLCRHRRLAYVRLREALFALCVAYFSSSGYSSIIILIHPFFGKRF